MLIVYLIQASRREMLSILLILEIIVFEIIVANEGFLKSNSEKFLKSCQR